MTRYLLDTNIISDVMRRPNGAVRRQIQDRGQGAVYTSVIVVSELRFGVARSRSARLSTQLDEVLGPMEVAPFAPPADRVYADLRSALERAGTPIGANDLWIAAQALHDGSVLVSDNEREFARVPGLAVENWLNA